jgi:hypothetical protein
VLTVLVFLSAVFIGVSKVYRIDSVMVEANTYSQAAKSEAEQLQKDLKAGYAGENLLVADEEIALSVIAKYPYFRLTKFEKRYPNVLYIEATEDMEVFAAKTQDGYYILSQSGTVLDVRKDLNNRIDGKENVVIEGSNPVGEIGDTVSGAGFAELMKICTVMAESLNGVRSNIAKIEFDRVEDGGRIFLCMREGVKICLVHAHLLTQEKAAALTEAYLNMKPADRLAGFLHVTESADGTQVLISYRAELLE